MTEGGKIYGKYPDRSASGKQWMTVGTVKEAKHESSMHTQGMQRSATWMGMHNVPKTLSRITEARKWITVETVKENTMSKEAEESLERLVNAEMERDPQFMDKVRYHNYLTEKYIWNQDCSNQFAYQGEAKCPSGINGEDWCEHVDAVAKAMVEKYPEEGE